MRLRYWLFVTIFFICHSEASEPPIPYSYWYWGFWAPDYMDVWVETADFTDIHGNLYTQAMSGLVSISQPEDGSGNPARIEKSYVLGSGKSQFAELPRQLFIRWQSLVEPQTYRATVDIPPQARELMRRRERVDCAVTGWADEYRDSITVMLAPGGIVRVWVGNSCFPATQVARVQAEVEPLGPYRGMSNGRYRQLKPVAKAYVEEHGIPYGAW